jgi:hypothetical protein
MGKIEREKELNRLANTLDGCAAIRQIWNKVKGMIVHPVFCKFPAPRAGDWA